MKSSELFFKLHHLAAVGGGGVGAQLCFPVSVHPPFAALKHAQQGIFIVAVPDGPGRKCAMNRLGASEQRESSHWR